MTDTEHCGECGEELEEDNSCSYCKHQWLLGEEAAEEGERENFTAIKRDYEMRR